jgi:hypothetical protein
LELTVKPAAIGSRRRPRDTALQQRTQSPSAIAIRSGHVVCLRNGGAPDGTCAAEHGPNKGEIAMPASTTQDSKPLEEALRIYRLTDTEHALAAALEARAPADELLFALRDPDRLDPATISAATSSAVTAAVNSPRFELALAWIPGGIPVTVHCYMDNLAIPSASGTFRGGRVFLTIPDQVVHPGGKLTYTLRFFQGRWKYQLWGRAEDRRTQLASGADPGPSSPDENLVIQTVDFNP